MTPNLHLWLIPVLPLVGGETTYRGSRSLDPRR